VAWRASVVDKYVRIAETMNNCFSHEGESKTKRKRTYILVAVHQKNMTGISPYPPSADKANDYLKVIFNVCGINCINSGYYLQILYANNMRV
jgi:hypothetical protein